MSSASVLILILVNWICGKMGTKSAIPLSSLASVTLALPFVWHLEEQFTWVPLCTYSQRACFW